MARYLGIDFGEKRIGLSISDESLSMAFPHEVILNDKNIVSNLEKVIKDQEISKVIIGESKNYLMKDNLIMSDILELKKIIEEMFEKDVVLYPEFMSTVQAERIQGKNKLIDASAATIILQGYLDKEKNDRNK